MISIFTRRITTYDERRRNERGVFTVRKFYVALFAAMYIALSALPGSAVLRDPGIRTFAPSPHDKEIIVKIRDGAKAGEALAPYLQPGKKAAPLAVRDRNLYVLAVEDPRSTVERLKADPRVEYAQPNVRYETQITTPNDGYWSKQPWMGWMSAPWAWDRTTGSAQVIVAVIDTGIDTAHADLAANIWANPKEIAGNAKDDDGNGFVDDVKGWNFVKGTNDPYDDNSHGTHCAGIIGAVGNNGAGIAGVNWTVRIIPMKVLNANGSGYTTDIVKAVDYVTALKLAGVDVTAVNCSFGSNTYDPTMKAALDRAAATCTVVAP